jgi:UDP-N-acetylmuramate--alanine ligase
MSDLSTITNNQDTVDLFNTKNKNGCGVALVVEHAQSFTQYPPTDYSPSIKMRFPQLKNALLNGNSGHMPDFPPSIGIIHFVCAGGHGMSAIALMLKALGYDVQGSDAKESINTERLRAAGIRVFIGHDKAHVKSAKLVVASSAALTIKYRVTENIEVEAARGKGIPVIHRAEMLAALMKNKKAIAVGGSHGKSTTTSMLAGILEAGGLTPSVLTGATMNLYKSNMHLGSGEWMVVEADESDGSFLWLPTLVTVVTNIDSDHVAFWKSEENTRAAFSQFVRNVPFYGLGVLCIDDPGVRQILPSLHDRNIVTYGTTKDADVRGENIDFSTRGCTFTVSVRDHKGGPRQNIGSFELNAFGLANVQNALAAIAVSIELGIDYQATADSLGTYPGVYQRFDRVGTVNGITIIDDHAAHPAEIKACNSMAKQAGARRIIAVNQPSGLPVVVKPWLAEYNTTFQDAEFVIIGQAEGDGEALAAQAREMIVESLKSHGVENVISMHDAQQLPELVARIGQDGDYVVCTGYRGSTEWARRLAKC